MTEIAAIDSSVIIAILKREPEAVGFSSALNQIERIVGWPTIFEMRLWTVRRGQQHNQSWLDAFIASPRTRCIAFDGIHEGIAHHAFRHFGKGRHPAALNFGDCMTYAIAVNANVPLLFKGSDFSKTDILAHSASVITEAIDI